MNYIFEWIGLLGIIICAIMLLWMHGGSWLIKTFIPNMLNMGYEQIQKGIR